MGLFLCTKHGAQGFVRMCRHHYQDVLQGKQTDYKTVGFLPGILCLKCYEGYDFDSINNYEPSKILDYTETQIAEIEQVLNEFYHKEEKYMQAECLECFRSKSV